MGSSLVLGWNQLLESIWMLSVWKSRQSAKLHALLCWCPPRLQVHSQPGVPVLSRAAPEKHRSLLAGRVWECQSWVVPPHFTALPQVPLCQRRGHCWWPSSLVSLAAERICTDCSSGSACTQHKSGHNMAMLTTPGLNRGNDQLPLPVGHTSYFGTQLLLFAKGAHFWCPCIFSCHGNSLN